METKTDELRRDNTGHAGEWDGRTTEELIADLRRTGEERLRVTIIERHEDLVRTLAQKFARPDVPAEDLVQTAWIALIRALDRFDPAHKTKFSTYATHCMVGEIKRYFRDRTWGLKVPRWLQEIAVNLGRMQDTLVQKLGREPSMAEMAAGFEITEDTLAQAMELRDNYQLTALDREYDYSDEGGTVRVGDTLGEPDGEMEAIVEFAPLYEALEQLEERDRIIIQRRFYEGYSQQQVADELALSQMHISRLERAALRRLNGIMTGEERAAC